MRNPSTSVFSPRIRSPTRTRVLTAPSALAVSPNSSINGMTAFLYGIVTFAPIHLPVRRYVIATQSEGTTTVKDAAELRIKESDRISSLLGELRKMGVEFTEHTDGYTIVGPQVLNPAQLESHGDHRMAMSLAIAGMIAQGDTEIMHSDVVDESYPEYTQTLRKLGAKIF